jgi:hypothetical protein
MLVDPYKVTPGEVTQIVAICHIALLVAWRIGCKEGTNTTGKATLSGRGPLDG